jgi:hypothetical protein
VKNLKAKDSGEIKTCPNRETPTYAPSPRSGHATMLPSESCSLRVALGCGDNLATYKTISFFYEPMLDPVDDIVDLDGHFLRAFSARLQFTRLSLNPGWVVQPNLVPFLESSCDG